MKDEYLKQSESGAILNTDDNGLKLYKKRKNKMKRDSERFTELESTVSDLNNKLDLILEKLG